MNYASVLRARKKIGDERRMLERESCQRNNDRALSRYHKLRGEVREQSQRRTEEIDNAYVVMISCNAAIDA